MENETPTATPELRTHNRLKDDDIRNLEVISGEDFSDIIDSMLLNDYRHIPNVIRLPNIRDDLAEKLGLEKDAAFVMKNGMSHIRPDRKGSYGQAFSDEEYRMIPEVMRNANFAVVDRYFKNFQIVFDDQNEENKVNKIVFNKDKLGNYLITIGKVDRQNAFSEERNEVVGVGFAPTIRTLRTGASSTRLRASPTTEHSITHENNSVNEKEYRMEKHIGMEDKEMDKGIEQMQANGGMSEPAMEADHLAGQDPRPDWIDEQGVPHWYDEDDGEIEVLPNEEIETLTEHQSKLKEETRTPEETTMEVQPNGEPNGLLTPKGYLKSLLSKAEIEVIEDAGIMGRILDEGKRVQKMAAKYGTSHDIDGEEAFSGFGTYVVSVNEENARRLGIKIASKRYGGSFYINGQPFNEFLQEKNFSPYWTSRLEQFKDYNVEYLADDFLRADVKGNPALEKERDALSTLFSLDLVEYKRERTFLYSVDIPDNDGTNYLLYGNPIGIENANRINERLERMSVEWRVTRNDIGKNVYFNTLSEKVFDGSQESASRFLKEAGYAGMEMNSANYIVFDDKDMKVTDRVQYMIDGESNVYGFAYDGKIYADPEIATSNTYAHEYTHLWDAYTQRTNPELWERGKDIFKGTSLWNEVVTDENYRSLSNDDEILSECHSRIVGRMAEKVLERIAEKDGGILRDQVVDWDNEVAEYVAGELGAEFPQPELGSESYVSNSVRLEIAREFLSRPMKDLMEGRKITQNVPFQNIIQKMADEHAFPDVSEYFKFNKIDNENFGKALDNFDGLNPLQLIRVGEIPPVMKALGISDNPIEMPQSVVSKALREEAAYPNDKKGHALTMEHVKRIPESLADPIMVFKSRTRDDSYVFFTEQKDEADRSIIIPVAVDKRYGRLVINEITSIYGKDNEAHFVKTNIEQGNLVYADKKRSLDWERECQIQFLAQVLPSEGSYSSILTKENLVNFVSAVGNEKIQKMAKSVENEIAEPTARKVETNTGQKVKASEIFKDFEESMIFSGISHKEFDRAMLDYLHQRSGREEAENGTFDKQAMFEFLVAQQIHDKRARSFALDKIERYEGMTVEFDADNIDLGYLRLSDREGAEEVKKELEELKAAHPILVRNLAGRDRSEKTAERLNRRAEADYTDPIETAEAWHNGADTDLRIGRPEETAEQSPFSAADPERVQELYEQAEAVEKMQQEAASSVEFDGEGNPRYPKNEAAEENAHSVMEKETGGKNAASGIVEPPAENEKNEPKEKRIETKDANGKISEANIEFGKTTIAKFAMVTQNGLKSYSDMAVASYEKTTDSYLLVSEDKSQQVRIQSSTMTALLSDERQKEIEKTNSQIEENKKIGRSTESLEVKKEMLERGMSVAQYNDFFQTRENCANNFRHNLSVYCRKEANSPLDALKIANALVKDMSAEERRKTKELLKNYAEVANSVRANKNSKILNFIGIVFTFMAGYGILDSIQKNMSTFKPHIKPCMEAIKAHWLPVSVFVLIVLIFIKPLGRCFQKFIDRIKAKE